MTTFPGSPRLLKGALVALNLPNPIPSVIVFQYNPSTLRRELKARFPEAGADRAEILRLEGPPQETISLDVEIDATDQLERGEGTATSVGIYPQLSALEMMIYPSSTHVIANAVLSALGVLEVVPPEAPLTLFVWGVQRVVPVLLSEFAITEEAYDTRLNPIRAKVSLRLRVLTYADLPITHPGYHLSLAHQVVKEAMAVVGTVSGLGAVIGGDIRLL